MKKNSYETPPKYPVCDGPRCDGPRSTVHDATVISLLPWPWRMTRPRMTSFVIQSGPMWDCCNQFRQSLPPSPTPPHTTTIIFDPCARHATRRGLAVIKLQRTRDSTHGAARPGRVSCITTRRRRLEPSHLQSATDKLSDSLV